jgi:hypothetical protein
MKLPLRTMKSINVQTIKKNRIPVALCRRLGYNKVYNPFGEGTKMSLEYTDPGVEQMYKDLSKLDMKSLSPDESSATWEIIKKLYKDERRRKRKMYLIRIAAALSTTLIVSSIILFMRKNDPKKTPES